MTCVPPSDFLDALRKIDSESTDVEPELPRFEPKVLGEWSTITPAASGMVTCPECGALVRQLVDRLALHYPNPQTTRPCVLSWPQNGKKPAKQPTEAT